MKRNIYEIFKLYPVGTVLLCLKSAFPRYIVGEKYIIKSFEDEGWVSSKVVGLLSKGLLDTSDSWTGYDGEWAPVELNKSLEDYL